MPHRLRLGAGLPMLDWCCEHIWALLMLAIVITAGAWFCILANEVNKLD